MTDISIDLLGIDARTAALKAREAVNAAAVSTASADRSDAARVKSETAASIAVAARGVVEAAGANATAQANIATTQAGRANADRVLGEIAAAAAGQYRQGIEQAVAGLPADGILPLQAATRVMLAAFVGQGAGRQAFLSETGRGGVFEWVTGNQSARVTADPDQAIYVPPASQPNGSAGVWRRVMTNGIAFASWGGVVALPTVANAVKVQRLLAMPEVTAVLLTAGVIGVESCIDVPSGKSLVGAGVGLTTLKLSAMWINQDPGGRNSIVRAVPGSRGVRIADITIDASKYASQRTNGFCMHEAVDFLVENFIVMNATAYACWATTYETFAPCSGVFRNGRTINSQVHLEATAANGVLFEDIQCSDGDADIPTEAMLHALAGSRNIVFSRIRAKGACAIGAALYIVGNTPGRTMDGIVVSNCDIESTSGSNAGTVITTGANAKIAGLRIIDTRLKSTGAGLALRKDAGSGCEDFELIGGAVEGFPSAVIVTGAQSGRMTRTVLRIYKGDQTILMGPVSCDGETRLVLDAIEIDAQGMTKVIVPSSPNIRILGQPLFRTPFPLLPMGPGHRLDYVLPADKDFDGNASVIPGWVLNGAGAGSYRFTIEGSYTVSAAAMNIVLKADTYGRRRLTARGEIEATLYGDNLVSDVLSVDGSGIVGAGVDAANQPRGFRARGVYAPTDSGGGFSIQAFTQSAGTVTVKAGSVLTVERLA